MSSKMLVKASKWLVSAALFRKNDILIVGLPKTGTTWLKTFLVELVRMEVHESFDSINLASFEYGGDFNQLGRYETGSTNVLKTHRARNFFHRKHELILGLYRDRYDSFISYYCYLIAQGVVEEDTSVVAFDNKVGYSARINNFYKSWSCIQHWIDFNAIDGENYDLLTVQFSKIFPLVPIDQVEQALVRSSKSNSFKRAEKSAQQKGKFKEGFNFVGGSSFKEKLKQRVTSDEKEIILSRLQSR